MDDKRNTSRLEALIIYGDKRIVVIEDLEIKLLKFTDYGIYQIKVWIKHWDKKSICPFDIECKICRDIFPDFLTCPCGEFGIDKCEKIARETIKFNEEGEQNDLCIQ